MAKQVKNIIVIDSRPSKIKIPIHSLVLNPLGDSNDLKSAAKSIDPQIMELAISNKNNILDQLNLFQKPKTTNARQIMTNKSPM